MGETPESDHPRALHERGAETEAIAGVLDSAAGGAGETLVFEGAAGTGKSSLLSLAERRARSRGMSLLPARGEELERGFAFGVATQLFGERLARAEADPELFAGAAGLARGLLEGPPVDASGEASFGVLHGLHWLTANLAERGPLLIAVDDLQWSDAPSLRFLLYLVGRIAALPAAVIVAIRSGEPQSARDQGLLDRIQATAGRSLTVRPLSPAGTADAVRDRIADADDAFCSRVAELTAGNPLLVRELLAAVREDEAETTSDAVARLAESAPRHTAGLLSVRLERLGPDARRLAEAVAVLEPDATLERAGRLAGLDPARATSAAGRLERADLISPREPLGFTHPLLRAAALASLSGAQRGGAHLDAARMLHEEGGSDEKVASQLRAGTRCGEEWAVGALARAGRAAQARGDPAGAVEHLAIAAETCADPATRGELLVELAAAETAVGSPEATVHFDQALAVVSEPRRRAEALAALAEARYVRSDYAGAVDAFARGLAEAGETGDDALAARMIAGLGAAAGLAPERAELAAELAGERLAKLVEAPPEHPGLPERILLAFAAGRCAASVLADRDRVLELAKLALGDGDPVAELGRIAIEPLLAALVMAEELELALRHFTTLLDRAREHGAVPTIANVLPMRSMCRHRLGSVGAALTDAEDAIRLCAELPSENLGLPTGLAMATVVQLDRGEREAAADATDVPDAQERWGFLPVFGVFRSAQGMVDLDRGRPDAAAAAFRDGNERMAAAGFVNPAYFQAGSDLALATARAGDRAAALEIIESDLELLRRFGAPRGIGMSLRVLGLIEGGAPGIAHLREAVELLRRGPAPLDLARGLVDLGSALRRAGDRTDARARLEEGMETAYECGAGGLAERAGGELRTLGLRPRRYAVSGPHALTPSELRTATMAAEGMSNREIAQDLFLTVRTIESHLTAAYRKLGIASRRELPDALRARALSGEEPGE